MEILIYTIGDMGLTFRRETRLGDRYLKVISMEIKMNELTSKALESGITLNSAKVVNLIGK